MKEREQSEKTVASRTSATGGNHAVAVASRTSATGGNHAVAVAEALEATGGNHAVAVASRTSATGGDHAVAEALEATTERPTEEIYKGDQSPLRMKAPGNDA